MYVYWTQSLYHSSDYSTLQCQSRPGALCLSSDSTHVEANLLAVTRFEEDELHDAIQGMEAFLTEPRPSQPCASEPASSSREVPRIRHLDLMQDESEFYRHLTNGTPVVITEVKIQGEWGPDYFISRHGKQKVTLEDCETGKKVSSDVNSFFSQFGKARANKKITKIKVR
jgi:hypothetical protein